MRSWALSWRVAFLWFVHSCFCWQCPRSDGSVLELKIVRIDRGQSCDIYDCIRENPKNNTLPTLHNSPLWAVRMLEGFGTPCLVLEAFRTLILLTYFLLPKCLLLLLSWIKLSGIRTQEVTCRSLFQPSRLYKNRTTGRVEVRTIPCFFFAFYGTKLHPFVFWTNAIIIRRRWREGWEY